MSFESIKASINLLFEEATHQPEDLHEAQETLREALEELRSSGLPVPQDLVDLELELENRLNILK